MASTRMESSSAPERITAPRSVGGAAVTRGRRRRSMYGEALAKDANRLANAVGVSRWGPAPKRRGDREVLDIDEVPVRTGPIPSEVLQRSRAPAVVGRESAAAPVEILLREGRTRARAQGFLKKAMDEDHVDAGQFSADA